MSLRHSVPLIIIIIKKVRTCYRGVGRQGTRSGCQSCRCSAADLGQYFQHKLVPGVTLHLPHRFRHGRRVQHNVIDGQYLITHVKRSTPNKHQMIIKNLVLFTSLATVDTILLQRHFSASEVMLSSGCNVF